MLGYRSAGAVAALVTVPLGPRLATARPAALLLVLVVMLAAEDRSRGISWARGTAGRTVRAG